MGFISKAINRNLIGKGKYEKEREVTEKNVHFKTKASFADIKKSLRIYVITEDTLSLVAHKLVIQEETSNRIVYMNRNKVVDSFTAILAAKEENGVLEGVFTFSNWLQQDGVSPHADKMYDLRQSVIEALQHADPEVEISYITNS